MSDRAISRRFRKNAQAVKRRHGKRAYNAYEARVKRAVKLRRKER